MFYFRRAITDIVEGFKNKDVWMMIGWLEIKLRYRRSVIGPFWITISIAVMVLALGILYSQVFKQSVSQYLPYVGVSMTVWFLISNLINEGCATFINSESQMKQVNIPTSTYVLRVIWRNLIVFFHNCIVIVVIMLIFGLFTPSALLFPIMLLLVATAFFFFSLLSGMICARFRDVPLIVASITQVLMFVTPIFWRKDFLTKYTWVTTFNPIFHMIELLRNPLLGRPFPYTSLWALLLMIFVLALTATLFLARYKHRLPYWV